MKGFLPLLMRLLTGLRSWPWSCAWIGPARLHPYCLKSVKVRSQNWYSTSVPAMDERVRSVACPFMSAGMTGCGLKVFSVISIAIIFLAGDGNVMRDQMLCMFYCHFVFIQRSGTMRCVLRHSISDGRLYSSGRRILVLSVQVCP